MADIVERNLLPEHVEKTLLAYIKRNRLWGKRLPSQRQLSAQLNVSLVTVSRGIKLLKEAGILFSKPRQGTYVVEKAISSKLNGSRTKLVIVCQDTVTDPRISDYFSARIMPLLRMSAEMNVETLFTKLSSMEEEEVFLQEYNSDSIGYMVFVATYRNIDQIQRIQQRFDAVSTVMVDHYVDSLPITGIVDDGASGMMTAAHYLIEAGHKRIAFLDISKPEFNPWKRSGYCTALVNHGIAVDEDLIALTRPEYSEIETVIDSLLKLSNPPTAFIAVDDNRAAMVISILASKGLQVPEDISVIGYGDYGNRTHNDMTSVRFDAADIGTTAVDYLMGNLSHKRGDMITVPTRLVIGKTTREL